MSVAERIASKFMASPVLNEDTLSDYEVIEDGGADRPSKRLTVKGTAFKALFLSGLLLASCMLLKFFPAAARADLSAMLISLLISVVLGLIVVYRPLSAPFTAPLFCIAEGVTLSCAAGFVNIDKDLLFGDAVFSTAAVVFVMLAAYCFFAVQLQSGSSSIILGTLFGPLVYYALAFLISLTGVKSAEFSLNPWMLLCSLVLCAVVACNITHDFKTIRAGEEAETHSVLEWYCAFALMFNLLWIYIELVRMAVCLAASFLWFCFWHRRGTEGWLLDIFDDD